MTKSINVKQNTAMPTKDTLSQAKFVVIFYVNVTVLFAKILQKRALKKTQPQNIGHSLQSCRMPGNPDYELLFDFTIQ